MRKLLSTMLLLLSCLAFAGQAVASASAGYSDCCMQGCKGMANCVNASCQGCATPQPATAPEAATPLPAGQCACSPRDAPFVSVPDPEPWTPPD